MQDAYFLIANCSPEASRITASSTHVRRLNLPSLQSRSKDELWAWLVPWVEQRLDWALIQGPSQPQIIYLNLWIPYTLIYLKPEKSTHLIFGQSLPV